MFSSILIKSLLIIHLLILSLIPTSYLLSYLQLNYFWMLSWAWFYLNFHLRAKIPSTKFHPPSLLTSSEQFQRKLSWTLLLIPRSEFSNFEGIWIAISIANSISEDNAFSSGRNVVKIRKKMRISLEAVVCNRQNSKRGPSFNIKMEMHAIYPFFA